jgi:hypothetical protein
MKMAKKTTTARVNRSAKSRSDAESTESNGPDVKREDEGVRGAPIERYRGEPNRQERTGAPGSLENETLDRSAPFNKTYGRQKDNQG